MTSAATSALTHVEFAHRVCELDENYSQQGCQALELEALRLTLTSSTLVESDLEIFKLAKYALNQVKGQHASGAISSASALTPFDIDKEGNGCTKCCKRMIATAKPYFTALHQYVNTHRKECAWGTVAVGSTVLGGYTLWGLKGVLTALVGDAGVGYRWHRYQSGKVAANSAASTMISAATSQ